jgi:cbb3-type cytochrome oxidase cytochrome c subunit
MKILDWGQDKNRVYPENEKDLDAIRTGDFKCIEFKVSMTKNPKSLVPDSFISTYYFLDRDSFDNALARWNEAFPDLYHYELTEVNTYKKEMTKINKIDNQIRTLVVNREKLRADSCGPDIADNVKTALIQAMNVLNKEIGYLTACKAKLKLLERV